MAGQTFTRAEFFATLDQQGEEAVRTNVVLKRYGAGNGKLQLAEEWLRLKDQARRDALDTEQLSIARTAKDAAVLAAEAASSAAEEARKQSRLAREANTIAKIALAVAIVAMATTTWLSIQQPPKPSSAPPASSATSSP